MAQASGREETEGDKLGETSAVWKAASRGVKGPGRPRAMKKAELPLIPEGSKETGGQPRTPKPFFPQLPLSLLYSYPLVVFCVVFISAFDEER